MLLQAEITVLRDQAAASSTNDELVSYLIVLSLLVSCIEKDNVLDVRLKAKQDRDKSED